MQSKSGKYPFSVTQNEIARITGLSRSTVGTILAGKFAHNYHKETRRQVLETAQRLNYRPNRQALTLKTGKSGVIGIVHTGSNLPLTHSKIALLVRILGEYRLAPLVYHNAWFENSKGIVDMLLDHKVQGVVLVNNYYEDHEGDLRRLCERVPVVQFGGRKSPGVPLVAPDKEGSLRPVVKHLAGLGHREIYQLDMGAGDYPTLNPLNAFTRLFHEPEFAGIRGKILKVRRHKGDAINIYARGNRFVNVVQKARRGRKCAVIAYNDDCAIGFHLRCLREGIRVPGEIAIVGYDNIALGEWMPVPLTTLWQPLEAMARRLIELLLAPETDPDLMELHPCPLIVRGSCGEV